MDEDYKVYKKNDVIQIVKRMSDKACIPNNEFNKDWVQYLQWLEDGNTPSETIEIPGGFL